MEQSFSFQLNQLRYFIGCKSLDYATDYNLQTAKQALYRISHPPTALKMFRFHPNIVIGVSRSTESIDCEEVFLKVHGEAAKNPTLWSNTSMIYRFSPFEFQFVVFFVNYFFVLIQLRAVVIGNCSAEGATYI